MPVRVLICDELPVVRDGLRSLLDCADGTEPRTGTQYVAN